MQYPRSSVLALLVLAFAPVWGQSKYVPVLHRRAPQIDDEFDYATRSVGRTALPSEASGEYALGGGGTIEIDLTVFVRYLSPLTNCGDSHEKY